MNRRLLLLCVVLVASLGPRAWGAASACRYTTTADTVLDVQTGLTWQRAPAPGTYTWADAGTYCQNLVLGGFSDWRLPRKIELESIVDRRVSAPSIDTTAFPGTPAVEFWTSSPGSGDSQYPYVVIFSLGNSDPRGLNNAYSVRCVR